mgnify:CR=1 FL=1
MHTASPFPIKYVKNEMDLINPAKEGTLRVMNAAKNNSIDRIIITSSNAAVYAGNKHITSFDETMWSNIDSKNVRAYTKSKTVAEKAAWEFAKKNSSIVLTTINPVLVWGPGIGDHSSSASLKIFDMLIKKALPMVPKVKMPLVDVRDVSKLHIQSLENSKSDNKRIIATSQNGISFLEISTMLRKLGFEKAPINLIPNKVIYSLAPFNREMRSTSFMIKRGCYETDISKTKAIFNWNEITLEKTLKDMTESLHLLDV